MEVEKIEIIKDWPEPKSIQNIEVFLCFANFYQQFIQGFNKIVALLTLILKIIKLSNKLASSKNNNSKSASEKNDSNNEVNRFGNIDVKYIKKLKKSKKLSKSRKSKSEKLVKSKKLSKSENFPNFGAKKAESIFLTLGTKRAFNYLQLAFIKAPLL